MRVDGEEEYVVCGLEGRRLTARLTREEVGLRRQVYPDGAFQEEQAENRWLVSGRYGVV